MTIATKEIILDAVNDYYDKQIEMLENAYDELGVKEVSNERDEVIREIKNTECN